MVATITELKTILVKARLPLWASMPAAPLTHLRDLYEEREKQGIYPSFAAPNDQRRWDPAQHLPGVRSIVTVAVPYQDLHSHALSFRKTKLSSAEQKKAVFGHVSRYAWGADYHEIVSQRLQHAASLLQSAGHIRKYFVAVDSTPLPDRELAVQGGVASFAWNSCVYTECGSHYVLGSLLVDAILPECHRASPTVLCSPQCGRCLRACPTGALERPFVLNPYRCLAFLTQANGVFPKKFRRALGSRIWGCDSCQDCCPMNSIATTEQTDLPTAHPGQTSGTWWDAARMLQWTKQEFETACRGTALYWRGKNTLQRNAALVLGNSKTRKHVPLLQQVLTEHNSAVVRGSALWSISQLDPRQGSQAAEHILAHETDPVLVTEAQGLLF